MHRDLMLQLLCCFLEPHQSQDYDYAISKTQETIKKIMRYNEILKKKFFVIFLRSIFFI